MIFMCKINECPECPECVDTTFTALYSAQCQSSTPVQVCTIKMSFAVCRSKLPYRKNYVCTRRNEARTLTTASAFACRNRNCVQQYIQTERTHTHHTHTYTIHAVYGKGKGNTNGWMDGGSDKAAHKSQNKFISHIELQC